MVDSKSRSGAESSSTAGVAALAPVAPVAAWLPPTVIMMTRTSATRNSDGRSTADPPALDRGTEDHRTMGHRRIERIRRKWYLAAGWKGQGQQIVVGPVWPDRM